MNPDINHNRHPFKSINRFLGNSVRTDLIGPEMWTIPTQFDDLTQRIGRNRPDQPADPFFPAQIPYNSWDLPAPGLRNVWCFGHQTDLCDILELEFFRVEGGQRTRLDIRPTRNCWTPACLTTYYRCLPLDRPGESRLAGELTVKETKCITNENVFVCELELLNDGRREMEYEIKPVMKHFPRDFNGAFHRVHCTILPKGLQADMSLEAHAVLVPDSLPTIRLGAYESRTVRMALAVRASGQDTARQAAEEALDDPDVFERNVREFDEWFENNVPAFHCRDNDLLKLYYYRWFLVYRAYHDPGKVIPDHPYKHPAYYESPGGRWYGCTIGLSVPMQIQEASWLRDPSSSFNHALNWAEAKPDAVYRWFIQYTPRAVWDLLLHHPSDKMLKGLFGSCLEFAFSRLDPDNPGTLPVMDGSWLTGAEYQTNLYQFTDPAWDWRADQEGSREYGFKIAQAIRLDTCAHSISNLFAVSFMAHRLEKTEEAERCLSFAERLLSNVKTRLWHAQDCMFYAADAESGRLADKAACYDSFAPFMWGLVRGEPYVKAFEKFFDPAWFWADFPITTVARNCPMYWPGNCVAGPTASSEEEPHEYACCWNGPTWHFTNTLMAEALGAAAVEETDLRAGWLDFMSRWNELHFFYGDRSVPCSIEHLRTADGARFSNAIDYFHNAWIDPFLKYWAGIRISDDGKSLSFDPFTDDEFTIANVPVLGRETTFVQERKAGCLYRKVLDSDGLTLAEGDSNKPVTLIPGI